MIACSRASTSASDRICSATRPGSGAYVPDRTDDSSFCSRAARSVAEARRAEEMVDSAPLLASTETRSRAPWAAAEPDDDGGACGAGARSGPAIGVLSETFMARLHWHSRQRECLQTFLR